jgi:hypothetical protein
VCSYQDLVCSAMVEKELDFNMFVAIVNNNLIAYDQARAYVTVDARGMLAHDAFGTLWREEHRALRHLVALAMPWIWSTFIQNGAVVFSNHAQPGATPVATWLQARDLASVIAAAIKANNPGAHGDGGAGGGNDSDDAWSGAGSPGTPGDRETAAEARRRKRENGKHGRVSLESEDGLLTETAIHVEMEEACRCAARSAVRLMCSKSWR